MSISTDERNWDLSYRIQNIPESKRQVKSQDGSRYYIDNGSSWVSFLLKGKPRQDLEMALAQTVMRNDGQILYYDVTSDPIDLYIIKDGIKNEFSFEMEKLVALVIITNFFDYQFNMFLSGGVNMIPIDDEIKYHYRKVYPPRNQPFPHLQPCLIELNIYDQIVKLRFTSSKFIDGIIIGLNWMELDSNLVIKKIMVRGQEYEIGQNF